MSEVRIEQLKKGDNNAFKALYEEVYPPLRYFCERIIKDQDEAKDVVIDSFVKYWEKSAHFNTLSDIKAFLYVSARNACFDYLDKIRSQKNYIRSLSAVETESPQLDSEYYAYEAVRIKQLYDEIERLPAQCKETFKLYYFERLSRTEIAEKLSISISTVHNHCAHAIQKLRLNLGEKRSLLAIILTALDFIKK